MPKFNDSERRKEQEKNELSAAELRAEFEVSISEITYVRDWLNKVMYELGSTIIYRELYVRKIFLILYAALEKDLAESKNKKTDNSFAPFIITFLIVFFVQLILFPIILSVLKNAESRFKVDQNSNIAKRLLKFITSTFIQPGYLFTRSLVIEPAKKQAGNPNENLKILQATKVDLENLTSFNKLYLFAVTVMYPLVYVCLAVHAVYSSANERDLRNIIIDADVIATSLRMLYQIYSQYRINQKQNAHEQLNFNLISSLVKDLPGITLKQKESQSSLGYLGLLFKIQDFKSKQSLIIYGKEYNLSYKDLFDAILYSLNLVKSLEIIKLDKHSVIISANMNQKYNYDLESLKQKFIYYIVRKHEINRVKKDILPELKFMTTSLPCEWHALEKKNEENLPTLVFLADISDLDGEQLTSLISVLNKIYAPEQLSIDNQEIIIETKIEDIHTGYKATFRGLKQTLDNRGKEQTRLPPGNTNTTTFQPTLSIEHADDVQRTVKRRNLPSDPASARLGNFFSQPKKNGPPPRLEWPNGTIYIHDKEIAKTENDDSRVIPLPCGGNNLMRYNRFLIIDPRLKQTVNNEKLFEKFLVCTRKIVGPVKQQGLKRLMIPYEGCDGRQHISEFEGKIIGNAARTYIRKVDTSNPDATLYIMDGFNLSPKQK